MAKRARGSTIRPGQRAPKPRGATTARPAASPAPVTPPPTLTADEEARAAALEAQIVADEKAADDASRRRERGRRAAASEDVARPSSIAVAASQEYGYVARDIRRIVTIGGGLIVFLVVLWVVVAVTGIGPF